MSLSWDDAGSLADLIACRWEMALKAGAVHFNPADSTQYQEVRIGKYIKRLIPDRAKQGSEIMSDHSMRIFSPFNENNFNYNDIPSAQELFRFKINNKTQRIIASDSPLTYSPHTLLVPTDKRPQFILKKDLITAFAIIENSPVFTLLFSSMGGGAGVNHMHWHLIAGKEHYPINNTRTEILINTKKIAVSVPVDWPTDSFIFKGCTDSVIESSFKFIKYLQESNLPHNIFLSHNSIFVNPRARKGARAIPGKKFGTWETILGICNACSQEEYKLIDEHIFQDALRQIMLNTAQKNFLATKIIINTCQ